MFRKLVSSLPFSPALVGQLGFYARRLGREQTTRRLGLIFTLLALVVQSFALFSPPEPTFAIAPTNQCPYSSTLTKDDPGCQACPSNTNIWVQDPGCNKNLQLTIEAINLSRSGVSAAGGTVSPSDRIQYTIHTTNKSSVTVTMPIEIPIRDLAEYTTVTDAGGGTYDTEAQKIAWGNVLLAGKQTDVRSFVMSVNDPLPITPTAIDNPQSYDCTLSVRYGNTLNSTVTCPTSKQIESVIKQLPETGTSENIILSVIVLILVTYLYVRARQMSREIKIIRRDFNVG